MATLRYAIFCMHTHMPCTDDWRNTMLTSEVIRGHWRSKHLNWSHVLTTRARVVHFLHVYTYNPYKYIRLCKIESTWGHTLTKTLRDTMFYIYSHITTRSDRCYVTLTYVVIWGHLRSLEVTDGQTLPSTSKDAIFCIYIHMTDASQHSMYDFDLGSL